MEKQQANGFPAHLSNQASLHRLFQPRAARSSDNALRGIAANIAMIRCLSFGSSRGPRRGAVLVKSLIQTRLFVPPSNLAHRFGSQRNQREATSAGDLPRFSCCSARARNTVRTGRTPPPSIPSSGSWSAFLRRTSSRLQAEISIAHKGTSNRRRKSLPHVCEGNTKVPARCLKIRVPFSGGGYGAP